MDLVSTYKKIVTDQSISWVLFKNGTCVMLLEPEENIKAQAIEILRVNGKVMPGSSSADFEVTKIPEIKGWVVTGDYPGIMMYVSIEEAGQKNKDFEIGLIGRNKRELDTKELEIVHVEDKKTLR